MRLFIGLDLPFDAKSAIHNYLTPFQKTPKGWVEPHDYHLTLLFIGEVKPEMFEDIKQRMSRIQFTPVEVSIQGLQFFPRRVAYMGVTLTPELEQIRNKICAVYPEWVPLENKAFVPHITVKRFQRYEYDELASMALEQKFKHPPVLIEKLTLFESKKDERGFKYHSLYEI